ncbi:pyroglutamyl-peptidase I family protein [Terrihabitans sp. B22-R8]|uniref:pyroglutamyl-peptidase I family protein n=1 Tax=Terrihabitans sp. B22-R8 TaxID=3425128 RepID=UPI00403D0235
MTLLIMAFGPFDGGSNASETLLRVLERDLPALAAWAGEEVRTLLLPVDTVRAPEILAEAMGPDVSRVLMMGQASGRNRIGLERFARNRRHFRVPDCEGRIIMGLPVIEGGPDLHEASWPGLAQTADALNADGIPAMVSEDCGSHLCNQVLYTVLHEAATAGRSCEALFLHLPLLPEQVIAGEPAAAKHEACAFMPVSMSLRAVEMILRLSARQRVAA